MLVNEGLCANVSVRMAAGGEATPKQLKEADELYDKAMRLDPDLRVVLGL